MVRKGVSCIDVRSLFRRRSSVWSAWANSCSVGVDGVQHIDYHISGVIPIVSCVLSDVCVDVVQASGNERTSGTLGGPSGSRFEPHPAAVEVAELGRRHAFDGQEVPIEVRYIVEADLIADLSDRQVVLRQVLTGQLDPQ